VNVLPHEADALYLTPSELRRLRSGLLRVCEDPRTDAADRGRAKALHFIVEETLAALARHAP
jgi:hypothetical protein